jgi:hypothetical protein
MNIVNEKIRHILFGEGKVISQEEGRISIQFHEQYGEKQFIYPDAFEKYLKLYDSDLEMSVLEKLHDKQAQIEEEELQKQQQYEEAAKSKALENLKLAAKKKKSSSKSRVTK